MTIEEREEYDQWMDMKVRSAVAPSSDPEAVHGWFSLSYCNHLVLPRTLLQSMPADWQKRFVTALDQLQAAYAHLDAPSCYRVTVTQECESCDGTGVSWADDDAYGDNEIDCPECAGEGVRDDPKADNIPHYNRGRTRVYPFGITPEQYLKEIR